jgi:hypothetical protein
MSTRKGSRLPPKPDTRVADPAVVDLCTALHRAYRTVRFYPPDHAVATRSLQLLQEAFDRALAGRAPVELVVGESELFHEDEPVYTQNDLRESMAFVMFRDGIRTITFFPGLEYGEAVGLVRSLSLALDVDKSDQDLATILWEQDSPHIDCQVVDPLLEGEVDSVETPGALAAKVGSRLDRARTADWQLQFEPEEVRSTRVMAVAGTLLRQEDFAAIEGAMATENDVLHEFIVVLGELLVSAHSDAQLAVASKAMSDLLISLLELGDVTSLNDGVAGLRDLIDAAPEKRALFEPILDQLTQTGKLRYLVEGLDGPRPAKREDVEAFLLLLGPGAYPAMVELLVEAEGRTSRKCLLNVMQTVGAVPLELVAPRLSDPRWYVARNMVCLLDPTRDPSALVYLERSLGHSDERVRREAARAIAGAEGPGTTRLLLKALDDPSPSVRVLALHRLTSIGGPDVAARLLATIKGRDFGVTWGNDMELFFDAMGAIGNDRAVPALNELWETRSRFRAAKNLELRLGALRALGLIGTPAARESLRRATRSGEAPVRRAAELNLAEAAKRAAT